MSRRLVLLGIASLAVSPSRAWLQTMKVRRVGHLAIAGPADALPPPPANWEAFRDALSARGYREGSNVVFEHGYAGGRPERFADLARDLVLRKVEVIFARGPHAVLAARNATRTVPIVAIDLETDPVSTGIVASLARPAGNVTGVFLDLAELTGKQLQLLKEVVPSLSRVAVVGDSAANASQFSALRVLGEGLQIRIHALELHGGEGVDRVFEEARRSAAQALIVLSNPVTLAHRSRLASLAIASRLPTMHLYRPHAEAGGLITYGPDLAAMHGRCAHYVAAILGGTPPGELPVERPALFELVINLKTAQTLGLNLSETLLLRATHIIR